MDDDKDIVEEAYTRAWKHAQMRRALFELMWERAHQAEPSKDYPDKIIPAKPMPHMSDAEIKRELKDILDIHLTGLF